MKKVSKLTHLSMNIRWTNYSLRFLLWSGWAVVLFDRFITAGLMGDGTLTSLLVGGHGALVIDQIITRPDTFVGYKTVPSLEKDSSEKNRLLRYVAAAIGIITYLIGVVWP